jgi:hypothetical protein
MFGPRAVEIMGGCRKIHSNELVLLDRYNCNVQVKEDDMGKEYSMRGREEQGMQDLGGYI